MHITKLSVIFAVALCATAAPSVPVLREITATVRLDRLSFAAGELVSGEVVLANAASHRIYVNIGVPANSRGGVDRLGYTQYKIERQVNHIWTRVEQDGCGICRIVPAPPPQKMKLGGGKERMYVPVGKMDAAESRRIRFSNLGFCHNLMEPGRYRVSLTELLHHYPPNVIQQGPQGSGSIALSPSFPELRLIESAPVIFTVTKPRDPALVARLAEARQKYSRDPDRSRRMFAAIEKETTDRASKAIVTTWRSTMQHALGVFDGETAAQ